MTDPKEPPLAPGLYVVSTPIGNLRDLTHRALDILQGCDVILAEDTRVTAKLLSAYGVRKRLERFDDHADEDRIQDLTVRLKAGERAALVSDAGTPLVSDPGYRLVRAAVEAGVDVIPAPGASAALAALAVSGLPTDRFLFAGFTPVKSNARRTMFSELAALRATLVFYETGPRLRESLLDMLAVFGDREAVVARELTKLHETILRAPLRALTADSRTEAPRGEIVVLVGPGTPEAASAEDVMAALREALSRLSPSAAAAEVAKITGRPKAELYKLALDLKSA